MSVVFLTWNPAKWPWKTLRRDVAAVRRGESGAEDWWSTGSSRSVKRGDRFYLLKQGKPPRGIMGSGRVTSDWYQREHWDAKRSARGDLVNCADIRFEVLLDPDREELLGGPVLQLGTLSRVNWKPQGSGTRVPETAVRELDILWKHHLRLVRPEMS
jgi:5-methylcytosine-specific restriction enzyme A